MTDHFGIQVRADVFVTLPATERAPLIGKTISQYRIEDQLGEGGMGIVYRALDTKLDRQVALKFLPQKFSDDPEAKARFVQEAKAASGLDHPNICTIYDIGEADDGSLFIAMAFYDGQTLKYALQGGAMPPERAASIGAQIADGLRKAHSADIVHRDIKPANIMVTAEGRVKILDFGVAKLVGGAELTKAGSTVGTTAYMSPEQARGEAVDVRADLWSLGVLLYEMLSGEKPFGGEYEQAIFYSVLNENPKPLPESVPDELSAVVEKLLAKSSSDRYQTADEALRALEPWADSSVRKVMSQSGSTTPTASAPPPLISNRWAAFAGAILLVAVVLWLFVPSTADVAAPPSDEFEHVAVLPFTVQGDPSLAYLRDGMVTLLSGMLDGAGPIRSVDVNRIRGYIERNPNSVIDPEGGRTIASDLGANRYVIGTVVQAGTERQLEATLYDIRGASLAGGQATFTGDDNFIPAVDDLARQIIRSQLDDSNTALPSLASETTSSVAALKNYLLADAALQNGEWLEALDLADAALQEDSTFALAWFTKAQAYGWIPDFEAESKAIRESYKYVGGLEGSLRLLIEGGYFFDVGKPYEARRVFRQMVAEYPTDLRAIGSLAETLLHYSQWFLKDSDPERESWNLFRKIIDLDPENAESQYHLAHLGLNIGGIALVDSLASAVEGDKSYYSNISDFLRKTDSEIQAYLDSDPDLRSVFDHAADAFQDYDYERTATLLVYLVDSGFDFSTVATSEVLAATQYTSSAGMLEQRDRYFQQDDTPEMRIHALVNRVFEAVLPGFECCSKSLDVLREEVLGLDAGDPAAYGSRYFTWHEAMRDYLLGLIAWRSGDKEALSRHAERFTTEWRSAGPIVESLGHELLGLVYWTDGDLEGALEQLYRVTTEHKWDEGFATIPGRPTWLFFISEIMVDLGRYDEAVKYLDYSHWTASPQFVAPFNIRLAEVYELDGNPESAIHTYERVIKMWKGADPELQPMVDQARQRRDELLVRLGREPADLPAPSSSP